MFYNCISDPVRQGAFLKRCQELNLSLELSNTVYNALSVISATPEQFYSIFNSVFTNDFVFDSLKIMVDNNLLTIDVQDKKSGVDDTCFLAIATEFKPNLKWEQG